MQRERFPADACPGSLLHGAHAFSFPSPKSLPLADTKRGITDRKRQIHAAAMDEPREPQKALQLLLDARHKMRPVLNTDPPQQQMRAAPSGTRHTRTDQADVTATAYVRMSSAAQLTGRNAVNTSLQDSRQQSATQPSRLSPAVTELVNAVVPHGGARKERSGSHANQQSASGGEPVPSTQAYTVQANGLLSQYRDVCSPSERVFVTVIKRVSVTTARYRGAPWLFSLCTTFHDMYCRSIKHWQSDARGREKERRIKRERCTAAEGTKRERGRKSRKNDHMP